MGLIISSIAPNLAWARHKGNLTVYFNSGDQLGSDAFACTAFRFRPEISTEYRVETPMVVAACAAMLVCCWAVVALWAAFASAWAVAW